MTSPATRKAILRVPYPPTANTFYRHVSIRGSVRVLISKKGREYQAAVARSLPRGLRPIRDRIKLTVTFCRKDRVSVDLGNLDKALLDALTKAGVWADDSLIDDQRFIRGPVDTGGPGYAEVEIEVLDNQP